MSQSDMQENWFTVFNVKVTARAYIIKIWLFLLYLKNGWSIWNQTWFGSTTLWAGVSCGKIGLLCSRSRSRQRFKMSVTVCPDNIFRTAEHFVTKLGMMMQHHEPECHAEKNCLLSSRSRSKRGLIWSKYDSFYYFLWTIDSSATKLCLMIHHHKPLCLVGKNMD